MLNNMTRSNGNFHSLILIPILQLISTIVLDGTFAASADKQDAVYR